MQTNCSKVTDLVQGNKELMDEKEAADFLSICPGTLSVWRSTNRYAIPFIRVGRRVRYRKSDLEAWLNSRVCRNGTNS